MHETIKILETKNEDKNIPTKKLVENLQNRGWNVSLTRIKKNDNT